MEQVTIKNIVTGVTRQIGIDDEVPDGWYIDMGYTLGVKVVESAPTKMLSIVWFFLAIILLLKLGEK